MYMITLGAEFVAAVILFASEAYATATLGLVILVNGVIDFLVNYLQCPRRSRSGVCSGCRAMGE